MRFDAIKYLLVALLAMVPLGCEPQPGAERQDETVTVEEQPEAQRDGMPAPQQQNQATPDGTAPANDAGAGEQPANATDPSY